MPTNYTEQVFASKYKDDFKDSDHYHRILFNSGRQLQARELTQMQTIIQKEMERFGRNIFKEGASVVPGGITLNNKYEFIKLDTTINPLPANVTPLIGDTIVGQTSAIEALVLQVELSTATDPATLYVKYTNTLSGTSSAAPIRFTPGEDIVGNSSSVSLSVQTTNTLLNPALGRGSKASIHKGTFFTQGHFVQADAQEILISKYSVTPDEVLGFIVSQDIVTVDDNINLYDNQGAVPNITAPGADRYRIVLTAALQSEIDSADTFVYIAKIRNGELIETVSGTGEYNKIAEFDALRTKEINGDFIKQAFKIKFDEHLTDATKLVMDVSAGVAYVNGYRASKGAPIQIDVNRAITSETVNSEPVAASYGNYVFASLYRGLPNIEEFELQNINDAVTFGGTNIGTCRVKAVEEDGANWRFYLMDIKMNAGQNFRDAKSIGTSVDQYFDLLLENNIAVQKEAVNNNLLFPFPEERVKAISDVTLTTQRRVTATTDGSGNASLPSLGTNEVYANSNQWIFARVGGGGAPFTPATITGVGTGSASITGAPSSTTIEGIVNVQKDGILKTKTITNTTTTTTITTPGTGASYIDLGKADIYDVTRIRAVDSDGIDLTSSFFIDTGARDNFYETGRLILKSTSPIPSGNVFVRFNYFTHSPSGHYFAASSYAGQVDYGNIPVHTLGNGTKVALYDVLDFRSRKDDTNSNFSSSTARVNELPVNTSIITADAEYYLPRYDKLVIDEQSNIKLLSGAPSLTPQFPSVPTNSLELYNVKFNPGTTDADDLTIQNIEAKGFTMRDISKLEERLEDLEEQTALSLLETDVNNFAVFDSVGNDRTKSGFLVDNFVDHVASDTSNQEYRGAIDPREQILRPIFNEEDIRMIYDSSLSTNAILKGDNVYIRHDNVLYIDQPIVSGTENINPFAVITNQGNLNLSPASDNWKEVVYIANRVINGGTRLDTRQSLLWNNWNWNWQGNRINSLRQGQTLASTDTGWQRNGRTNRRTTVVDTVVRDEVVREQVGDRVVNVALIPFMRSRRVYFKAEGLAPNMRMWPYFDGRLVSDWVKQEPYVRVATSVADYGNTYNNAVGHPFGATALYSDAQGVLEGSFFIPNTNTIRFRTGAREFKLLDITANVNNDALSIASTLFTSNGVLETRQRDILSTRVITVAGTSRTQVVRHDPLAQSFYVDEKNGIFITKVRIYFKTKDPSVSVSCEIRPMVNGQPSSDTIVPGTVKFLPPASVSTSTDASVGTDFEFDEPAYLSPFTEYAIVLKAESVNYNVYIAETEEFILNSTAKKVTKQPTLGSLFKSQNASTWEPAQTKDLMFQIYKAKFDASANVILENVSVPQQLLTENPLTIAGGGTDVTVNQANHGFITGDTVSIYGLDSAKNYGGGIVGTDIMGNKTVGVLDENNYIITSSSGNASGSAFSFGDDNVRATRNYMFETIVPFVETLIPQETDLTLSGKFTSGKSLAGTETPYLKDAAFVDLSMRENNSFSFAKMVSNRAGEIANMGGTKSATLSLNLTTADQNVSPVLDMQRSSMWLIHNNIDFQDSAGSLQVITGERNTPISFADETDPVGGSHIAKHIVRPITLEQAAIGMKVLLAANVPQQAAFDVYYKAVEEDINFEDVNWTLIAPEKQLPSDENPNIFREYEYLVGGSAGLASAFTKFTLKIVMKSRNSAKPPLFRDLRIIALAV
jgi:hypothetical protein